MTNKPSPIHYILTCLIFVLVFFLWNSNKNAKIISEQALLVDTIRLKEISTLSKLLSGTISKKALLASSWSTQEDFFSKEEENLIGIGTLSFYFDSNGNLVKIESFANSDK